LISLPPGIITVLNTPFTDDNSVDLVSLRRNVQRSIHAGVAGFVVPALAAEVYELTDDERVAMVQAVVEEVRDQRAQCVVIGSATARTADRRRWNARRLIEIGCQAVLVALDARDESVINELTALADGESTPLLLQDWDPRGTGFPLDVIARIAELVPSVIGLKIEVVPAGPKFTAIRERFGSRFHLSGGWTVLQLIEALDRGVDAFMPTGLHEIYTDVDTSYREGNRERAQEAFRSLLPILAFSNQHLNTSIHFFKRLLHAEGTYATARCRTPHDQFDRFHERIADELIAYAMAQTSEHGGRAAP
jgi:dihydrodipicolinate synthase/N-acetylneuraminate lyase